MPASRWTHCLAQILKHEGGYVDHPADPGGATNMGITRRTLADWRGVVPWQDLPKSDVQDLTRAEAAAIYKARYWQRVKAGSLPAGVDLVVFDYAVNSGPDRAVKALQALVGVARDGIVGPVTLGAVAQRSPRALVEAVCEQRLGFLRGLSTFSTFGRGWTNRVAAIRADALRDASATPVPQPHRNQQGEETMALLEGYKTYAIGALMLLVGVAQMAGIGLPGFGEYSGPQLVMEALAVIFLRRGLQTATGKA